MASSFSHPDPHEGELPAALRAVWLLRSKVFLRESGWWLVLLGYDPQAHRFRSKGYLGYALVFFILWGGMVFFLLTDGLMSLLTALPWIGPANLAFILGSLAVLGFLVLELNQSARRGPLSFTDQDAHLICMTPIDRRLVVLAWFAETWFSQAVWLWIFLAALACAAFQLGAPANRIIENLPGLILAGLQTLSIVMPLSAGGLALIWSLCLGRLKIRTAPRRSGWMPALLFGILIAGTLILVWPQVLHWLSGFIPLLGSMLGRVHYIPSLAAGLSLGMVGAATLWALSRNVNLASAAQKTRASYSLQAARFTGRADLVSDLVFKERLGAGRAPAWLPDWGGWPVLLWENLLRVRYLTQLQEILLWSGVLGLNLSLAAFQSADLQIFLGILWVVLLLQIFEPLLQRQLSRWWLYRSLPVRTELLVMDIALLPVAAAWLTGLAALLVAGWMGLAVPAVAVWGYFVSAPGVILCGMLDVLPRARTIHLLSGLCPGPELLATLFSLLFISLYCGCAWLLLAYLHLPGTAGMAILVPLSLAGLYGLFKQAAFRMKHLR